MQAGAYGHPNLKASAARRLLKAASRCRKLQDTNQRPQRAPCVFFISFFPRGRQICRRWAQRGLEGKSPSHQSRQINSSFEVEKDRTETAGSNTKLKLFDITLQLLPAAPGTLALGLEWTRGSARIHRRPHLVLILDVNLIHCVRARALATAFVN